MHQIFQAHLTHNLTHIPFQHLLSQHLQLSKILPQQGLSRSGKGIPIGGDFHIGHAIHTDIDKLLRRNALLRLDVNGDDVQGQAV